MPSEFEASRGRVRVGSFLAWSLAALGTSAAVLVAMAVVGGLAATLCEIILTGSLQMATDGVSPDAMNLGMVVAQLAVIAIALPWWRYVMQRSFVRERAAAMPPRTFRERALTWMSLALLGIGLQVVISLILTIASLFFPTTMDEYSELMTDAGVGVLTVLNVLSTAILAPICEEIACRGIMLEYSLRAVCPAWNGKTGARGVTVTATMFLLANALQAAIFGFMHMNIVQGTYAFAIGLLQGWIYWRTGRLRYAIGSHLAVNASSFLLDPLLELSAWLPELVGSTWFLVVGVGSLVVGAMLFARIWCSRGAVVPMAPGGGVVPGAVGEAAPSAPAASLDGADGPLPGRAVSGSAAPVPPGSPVAPAAPVPPGTPVAPAAPVLPGAPAVPAAPAAPVPSGSPTVPARDLSAAPQPGCDPAALDR